jgi:hypothetical protein
MTASYLFPTERVQVAQQFPPQKRNTKAIGDISEAMVISSLIRNGYLVSIPFGENHRYDVIADNGERLLRVQVKTGRLRNGVIRFVCCSSHQHRRSGPTATRPYFGQIEYLAVYCPGNGKVYFVPESELVATSGHLRVDPALNRQARKIRWAAEYELA